MQRTWFLKTILWLVLGGLCLVPAVQDLQATPASNPADEFVGPFPSWADAKRDYGAVGDGQNDDTAALQKALDELRHEDRKRFVLYVPAGTYRITQQLVLDSRLYTGVIGEDPALTVIKWDGPADGVMLYINGVAYSRFNRITWDGSGSLVF